MVISMTITTIIVTTVIFIPITTIAFIITTTTTTIMSAIFMLGGGASGKFRLKFWVLTQSRKLGLAGKFPTFFRRFRIEECWALLRRLYLIFNSGRGAMKCLASIGYPLQVGSSTKQKLTATKASGFTGSFSIVLVSAWCGQLTYVHAGSGGQAAFTTGQHRCSFGRMCFDWGMRRACFLVGIVRINGMGMVPLTVMVMVMMMMMRITV